MISFSKIVKSLSLGFAIFLFVNIVSCSREETRNEKSRLYTNLGTIGNEEVQKLFAQHLNTAKKCSPMGAKKRAIVTGFGPFGGGSLNISGVVIDNMANPAFWPASINTADGNLPDMQQIELRQGMNESADYGGHVTMRQLTIDGIDYDVCLIVLDVLWDLAAAIIVDEAIRFEPNLILMTGQGEYDARFEKGSVNMAVRENGFNADGSTAEHNRPISDYVLKTTPPGEEVMYMKWDNKKLSSATEPTIKDLGFNVVASNTPYSTGSYICNNVSYAVLRALQDQKVELVEGLITLYPRLSTELKAGFFHFPYMDDFSKEQIYNWARVMAMTIHLL